MRIYLKNEKGAMGTIPANEIDNREETSHTKYRILRKVFAIIRKILIFQSRTLPKSETVTPITHTNDHYFSLYFFWLPNCNMVL